MSNKIFIVARIEGEYAYIRDEISGDEVFIAMSILPPGVDEGDRLEYDTVCFNIIK